ncbi:aldose 1-epimerase family protein [Blastococcus tunisiensis]|uniref:Aldose 1-epimerase n=1 Tax=Blastococcus tunisiensis TaxID=1798228 RepID=A0A1I2DSH4_9ACTN|nr:aldose 1-epimerase family protein [Blastococcus sp. DSM 46838]SFE83634.1 aldose 1-epimerase [Blastococcus sp. DSM 46838]
MDATAPSGKQHALTLGDQDLVVTEAGGTLRRYAVGDVDVLDGFAADGMCTGARGQTFVPWPNRIGCGSYSFAGGEHQLPLSEPGAGNAIHGLTRWASWQLADDDHVSLRLTHRLHAQPGYPFPLRCRLTYRLLPQGLRVETSTTNEGAGPCPYATGAHPYVSLGVQRVDDLTVTLPAATWYPTDDRGIPTGRRSVEGTGHDLREPRRIGDLQLDTAFTDLDRDSDGGSTVRICAPDGRAAELWLDGSYRYVELFTGDSLPDPAERRRSLGVEPMTAAPDAFRSGDGLRTLEPGETATSVWELRPRLP